MRDQGAANESNSNNTTTAVRQQWVLVILIYPATASKLHPLNMCPHGRKVNCHNNMHDYFELLQTQLLCSVSWPAFTNLILMLYEAHQ